VNKLNEQQHNTLSKKFEFVTIGSFIVIGLPLIGAICVGAYGLTVWVYQMEEYGF